MSQTSNGESLQLFRVGPQLMPQVCSVQSGRHRSTELDPKSTDDQPWRKAVPHAGRGTYPRIKHLDVHLERSRSLAYQDSQQHRAHAVVPAGGRLSSLCTCGECTLIVQDEDGLKQRYPVREVGPRCEADYAWDYPTAHSKRIQLSCDGVPMPRNIDIMAIGIQPPMKVSVSRP
jgi:hypothetical protein